MFSGLAYFVSPLSVSCATGSCTHTFPFPSYVFPLYLTLVLLWTVDSSPVTHLSPVSLFVLVTHMLMFLAYVFLISSCRLVSRG